MNWLGEFDAMKRTWEIMQPPLSFKEGAFDALLIIAGSFFWARRDAVLYDVVLRSVDRLVEAMPHGYPNHCCQTPHALERLLPTMAVTIRRFDILSLDAVVPGCCPPTTATARA